MGKIEEMAIKDLPVVITGNGWNDWDENEVLRKGYILGANAVLQEIENILSLEYNTMATVDLIEEKVKELKG